MIADLDIYNVLNVSAVTDLLDDYLTEKALFSGTVAPQDYTGVNYINFYAVGPDNASLEFKELLYIANCRSKTHRTSRDLAYAVSNQLSRHGKDGYMTYTVVSGTIPPRDKSDVFNTPVEITIKKRG